MYDKFELHKVMKDEVHLIFPVQSDDDREYKKYFPCLKLFEFPGIVLIRRQDSISRGIQNWSAAVCNYWPIVLLTLLLSIVAGICVWALVSDHVCSLMSRNAHNNKIGKITKYRRQFDDFDNFGKYGDCGEILSNCQMYVNFRHIRHIRQIRQLSKEPLLSLHLQWFASC